MEPLSFALLGLLATLIGYLLGIKKGGNGGDGKSGNSPKGSK
jgi:hypothetical protein